MTEAIGTNTAPILNTVRRPTNYGSTHEVQLRANVSRGNDTPEHQIAAKKLDRALSTSEPPRTDVPRGYYLNIVV
ncbi:MAG: hypothetical protein HQ501_00010 [Rhodospirillales bacterium]|nr:hypothetical protein [Rhodospirillales bacterium]